MTTMTQHYFRKVIHIRAEDSPNVRYALAQMEGGNEPDGRVIVPGVLPYDVYRQRRATWDPVMQCIGLDADFWEGAESLLYPPLWLNLAASYADELERKDFYALTGSVRQAKSIGIDPGQGGDKTALAASDEYGLIELWSDRTPDTNEIVKVVKWFGRRHGVDPKDWIFDIGGGGKQHADRLRSEGYEVQTVAFNESPNPKVKRGTTKTKKVKVHEKEERLAYSNRRSEIYGKLRGWLDPGHHSLRGHPFAIPSTYTELRRQLSLFPYLLDEEGRMWLPPKRRRSDKRKKLGYDKTLQDIMGCSPDESDALVLSVYGMGVTERPKRRRVGAAW